MPNEKKNIKTYQKELITFFVLNLIIYSCFIFGTKFIFELLNKPELSNLIENGIILAVFSFVVLVLNYTLKSNLKYKLVFWRRENILPGCRIFTELKSFKDNRIDKSVLTKKHGNLPTDHEEQNNLWYKIFKKYEFEPMIFESHRKFLMFRDLTGLSFIILIVFPITTLIFILLSIIVLTGTLLNYILIYVLFLIVQYIILAHIAKDRGNRFACNVLAEDSSMK